MCYAPRIISLNSLIASHKKEQLYYRRTQKEGIFDNSEVVMNPFAGKRKYILKALVVTVLVYLALYSQNIMIVRGLMLVFGVLALLPDRFNK